MFIGGSDGAETFPAGKEPRSEPARRGPIAAAISETAESVRDRSALEAQIQAENDALAQEHVPGLITDMIPLTPPKGLAPVPQQAAKAKTTFQLQRPQGSAKCTAANGRLEIRLARDFSTVDRRKLEAAVASLLDQIE